VVAFQSYWELWGLSKIILVKCLNQSSESKERNFVWVGDNSCKTIMFLCMRKEEKERDIGNSTSMECEL
jgi:hypothetical protein